MDELIQKIIYGAYIPFVIAFVSIAVPMVSLLLSIFSRGREEVINDQRMEIERLSSEIQANELTKHHSFLNLVLKTLTRRYKLLLLNPRAYLLLLVTPPIFSVVFALISLQNHHKSLFIYLALASIIIFFILLRSFIIIVADVTARQDSEKTERERSTLEVLQNILKAVDPKNLRVKKFSIDVNKTTLTDGIILPPVVLGLDTEWKISFRNNEKEIPAKKVEIGIQFPKEEFSIKEQSEYNLYAPENIIRFNQEYVEQNTNMNFSTPIIFTPKLTGAHEIRFWVKGENIETAYLKGQVSVEVQA